MFLAVPLPEAIAAQVSAIVAELSPLGWPVRWVRPEAVHITLHFLGDTPPERAELLRFALPAAVANVRSFTMQTTQLGVFPNSRRPRVIWLGLADPGHQLEQLYRTLAGSLRSLDFPVEDRRFSPHITLGRVRDNVDMDPTRLASEIQHRLDWISLTLEAQSLPVNEVILYRSFLSREGAQYQPLVRAPLR